MQLARQTRPFTSHQQHRRAAVRACARRETKCAWTHARDASLAAAAAAILLSPGQAWADMQMVQPSQVMQMAKPLPQQRVDKGRVWGVTVIGAASLFLITLTIENYDAWFPAISKANKASLEMKKAMEVAEKAAAKAQPRSVPPPPQPTPAVGASAPAPQPVLRQQQAAALVSMPGGPAAVATAVVAPAPAAAPVPVVQPESDSQALASEGKELVKAL